MGDVGVEMFVYVPVCEMVSERLCFSAHFGRWRCEFGGEVSRLFQIWRTGEIKRFGAISRRSHKLVKCGRLKDAESLKNLEVLDRDIHGGGSRESAAGERCGEVAQFVSVSKSTSPLHLES